MIVNSIVGYKFNNKYNNNYSSPMSKGYIYQQRPDVFFGSSVHSAENLQKMVRQISKGNDMHGVFENVYECVLYNVRNIHQINFFKKLMGANLEESHPLIKRMNLNSQVDFWDIFKSIHTEENLEVKSYILDFLLKRPEYVRRIPGCHSSHIMELSDNKCQKEFVQYFDENYDLLETNDSFSKDFAFLLVNAETPERVDLYKNFIDFVKMRYKGKIFENLRLGTYLHAIDNKHNCQYVKEMLPITSEKDRCYFLDWYLVNGIGTKEASETLQELFKTVKKNKIKLNLPADELIVAVNSDKNLGVEGLLELDKKYGICRCNPHCAPTGYDEYFWDKYTKIHSLAGTCDLNEYSRGFFEYMMANVNMQDYEKYKELLSESVLKSITTPKKLQDAIEIVDAYIKEPELMDAIPWHFDSMFSRYNMSVEEIIAMKRKGMLGQNYLQRSNQVNRELRELEIKYQESVSNKI